MIRWTFHLLSALSTIALCAVLVLWVRGYRTTDELEAGYWHYTPHRGYPQIRDARMLHILHRRGRTSVEFYQRNCVCTVTNWRWGPGPHHERWAWNHQPAEIPVRPTTIADYQTTRRLGVDYGHRPRFFGWTASFHDGHLATLTGTMPAAWIVWMTRRRRRIRQGYCPQCGYDLRASRERCPECGRAIPRQKRQAARFELGRPAGVRLN